MVNIPQLIGTKHDSLSFFLLYFSFLFFSLEPNRSRIQLWHGICLQFKEGKIFFANRGNETDLTPLSLLWDVAVVKKKQFDLTRTMRPKKSSLVPDLRPKHCRKKEMLLVNVFIFTLFIWEYYVKISHWDNSISNHRIFIKFC